MTGGAGGVGRAIAERLADDGRVVVLDVAGRLGWRHAGVMLVSGDACDPQTAQRAAAAAAGPLAGWVDNAAIFRDAGLADATVAQILGIINENLAMAVTGCHTAVNHFLAHQRTGAIVNVSSHRAQRPGAGLSMAPSSRLTADE